MLATLHAMADAASSPPAPWRITSTAGQAGVFHARLVPRADRSIWVHRVERPALVLGSTQRLDVVRASEAARAGIEVTRRRSGGGLVLVHPDHARWVDVVLPREDPLWEDDIGRSFAWLGAAWSDAVRSGLAEERADVAHHRGPLVATPWSRLLCFAGLGPGEVTVGGSKVVGMSQRRTRDWARFQCLLLAQPDLDLLARLVEPEACPGPLDELLGLPIGCPMDLDRALASFLAAEQFAAAATADEK